MVKSRINYNKKLSLGGNPKHRKAWTDEILYKNQEWECSES